MRNHSARDGGAEAQLQSATLPPTLNTTSTTASNGNAQSPVSKPASWLSTLRRPKTSPGPRASPFLKRSLFSEDVRRDSGLPPPSPTGTMGTTGVQMAAEGGGAQVPMLPEIVVQDQPAVCKEEEEVFANANGGPTETTDLVASEGEYISQEQESQEQDERLDLLGPFEGITTDIPTGSFEDLMSPDNLQFSKRGSMLLGGERANARRKSKLLSLMPTRVPQPEPQPVIEEAPPAEPTRRPPRAPTPAPRFLSADEAMLSQRVRLMYEHGDERAAEWMVSSSNSQCHSHSVSKEDVEVIAEESEPEDDPPRGLSLTKIRTAGASVERSASFTKNRRSSLIPREPYESAGGLEDWQDVAGGGVDRYGFILPKPLGSRASSNASSAFEQTPRISRVATNLQVASESPRRKRTLRRAASNARSARSTPTGDSNNNNNNNDGNGNGFLQRKHSKRSLKPQGSVYSYQSGNSTPGGTLSHSPLRYAANRLPHNKERRWMDEASDMLTLPPGLADIAELKDDGKVALALKKKEWDREDKWRKMGKVVKSSRRGEGMVFDFDPKDPKVIARAWKGIPDRWRASAWYSFLAHSAENNPNSVADDELVDEFYRCLDEDGPDDVQIDMDVPRTISSHIMFRRRYRGGQRLLFRVLHALSIYLPDTGYVQGMAALAATLLCYFDEENAFIMMVRLWQLRGLERLYAAGFDGLMQALDEFEREWLAEGDVAKQLTELGITSTAYGTRWYLTLFNYSIPFPAQLRVWDVFMMLGDVSNSCTPAIAKSFGADLDVLHATSAALIDATREILLDSDFENAMKVLTSWIPVKDEELLMKVAQAEWKIRKKRGGKKVT